MPPNLALNPLAITNAGPQAEPFKMRDGKGLYLEVRPSGLKVFRYRYRIGGKENVFTLGEFGNRPGQLTLAAAREARDKARVLVKQGIHPGNERNSLIANNIAEAQNTFKAVAEEWYADNEGEWSDKYRSQERTGLDRDLYPEFGARPIRSITSAAFLSVLKKFKATATWAILLQQWTGAIFRYAIAHQRAEIDITYAVRGTIKKPKVKHHSPLALSKVPAFLKALRGATAQRQTIIAAELLLLLFVRPSELIEAEWSEFDLDGALWKIPAARMKNRELHYVPLSAQAVTLLRELHSLTGNRKHLFPNRYHPSRAMDTGTLNNLIDRIGYAGRVSPHGFRATASTALYEAGYRSDLIERQLAHAQRNQSRAAYDQSQFLQERRAMLQHWSNMVNGGASSTNVVPIKATAAA